MPDLNQVDWSSFESGILTNIKQITKHKTVARIGGIMLKQGKVVWIDYKNNSGLIEDRKGNEYIFTQYECKDDEFPPIGREVSFIHDTDWTTIRVATNVHQ